MANVKITDLTAATSLTGAESIEIVQGGTNKKTTLDDLPISDATTTALSGKSDTGHSHAGTYQPASANLDEYAAVNPTAAGLALLDDADAAAQRTTLGLGDAATKNTGTSAGTVAAGDHAHSGTYEAALGNPAANGYVLSSTTAGVRTWVAPGGGGGGDMYKATYDTDNDGTVDAAEDSAKLAGTTPTAAGLALLDDADAAAQRTTLGLGDASTKNTGTSAGTVAAGDHAHAGTYQPASANLDEFAAVNPTTAGLALLDDADAAAQRTTLGLGDAATKNTGTSAGTVAAGDHAHSGTYQPYDANLPAWPSAVSATEVGYLDGVSSAIQTQIDACAKKAGDADVDMNNNDIVGIKTLGLEGDYDIGSKSASFTLDLNNGQYQKVTFTGSGALTITLTAPTAPGVYHIEMTNAGLRTITFAYTSGTPVFRKKGGTPLSAFTSSGVDLLLLRWNGTDYFVEQSLDWKA